MLLDLARHSLQASPKLVNLDCDTAEGERLASADAVLFNQRTQLGPAIDGRFADAGPGGHFSDRDLVAAREKLGAGLLDVAFEIGLPHAPSALAMSRSRRSTRRR